MRLVYNEPRHHVYDRKTGKQLGSFTLREMTHENAQKEAEARYPEHVDKKCPILSFRITMSM